MLNLFILALDMCCFAWAGLDIRQWHVNFNLQTSFGDDIGMKLIKKVFFYSLDTIDVQSIQGSLFVMYIVHMYVLSRFISHSISPEDTVSFSLSSLNGPCSRLLIHHVSNPSFKEFIQFSLLKFLSPSQPCKAG